MRSVIIILILVAPGIVSAYESVTAPKRCDFDSLVSPVRVQAVPPVKVDVPGIIMGDQIKRLETLLKGLGVRLMTDPKVYFKAEREFMESQGLIDPYGDTSNPEFKELRSVFAVSHLRKKIKAIEEALGESFQSRIETDPRFRKRALSFVQEYIEHPPFTGDYTARALPGGRPEVPVGKLESTEAFFDPEATHFAHLMNFVQTMANMRGFVDPDVLKLAKYENPSELLALIERTEIAVALERVFSGLNRDFGRRTGRLQVSEIGPMRDTFSPPR